MSDIISFPEIKARESRRHSRTQAARKVGLGVLGAATVVTVASKLGIMSNSVPETSGNGQPTPQQQAASARAEAQQSASSDKELKVCIPQGDMEFTFKAGQGENAAILAIKGSGLGEGDPCWDDAKAIVDKQLRALHPKDPNFAKDPNYVPQPKQGDVIHEPASFVSQ